MRMNELYMRCPCCGETIKIELTISPAVIAEKQTDIISLFGLEFGELEGGECDGQGEDFTFRKPG